METTTISNFDITVCHALKVLRQQKGMTTEEVYEKTKIDIEVIENQYRALKLMTLNQLLNVYQCSFQQFFSQV